MGILVVKKATAFWDRLAKSYAASPIKDMESYKFTLQRTRSYLTVQDKILEIGAGTGSTALLLASSVAHMTVTDISPEMVKIGQANALQQGVNNIDFLVDDAMVETLSGPYDVILAHNLLHLIEDLSSVLRRAHELLRPGGLFISKTPCKPQGFGSISYRLMEIFLPIMQLLGKAPFVAIPGVATLERLIEDQNFQIIEACNCPTRYIVARKTAGKPENSRQSAQQVNG